MMSSLKRKLEKKESNFIYILLGYSMEIIHAADLHLGSKLNSKFNKEISTQRKAELKNSFPRLVDYAKTNHINNILLSGDIFDMDTPSKEIKKHFYSVIKSNPDITFYYLKGNHDLNVEDSDIEQYLQLPNLKTFKDTWTYYNIDENICIAGIEVTNKNRENYYSTLVLDKDKINIVMLHGQIQTSNSKGDIVLNKLKKKKINYLALGHIHMHMEGILEENIESKNHNVYYVYPGCLEPRGFDEAGDHGFVLLDINESGEKEITHSFIKFSKRTIVEKDVDITNLNTSYEMKEKILKEVNPINKDDIYRINLIGEIDFMIDNIEKEVEDELESNFYFVNIKDKTSRKIDVSAYEKDISLKGEFVRTVMNNNELSPEEKQFIIKSGLKALNKEKLEL